jgi:hypothetical protein
MRHTHARAHTDKRTKRIFQATGGELFERIGSRAHYSETEAARCFYQVDVQMH